MGSSKFGALKQIREQSSEPKPGVPAQSEVADQGQGFSQPAAPRRGRPPGKRSNRGYVQMTAYIRRDVHRAANLTLLQADDQRDLSELVDQLLSDWIEQQRG